MKRFYKVSDVEPGPNGGYRVTLDGKPIQTPAKTWLLLPTLKLAAAISDEWHAQEREVVPDTMPLMQLACTAIDRVTPRRRAVIDEIVAYAENDHLCYRAAFPAELAVRQDSLWQPLLDWAARRYRASLLVTTGVVPVNQPPAAIRNLREAVEAHDDMVLAALRCVAAATGSLVLTLALAEGYVGPEQAFELSRIDEVYQREKWGEDPEAAARSESVRGDIGACARFMELCRAG